MKIVYAPDSYGGFLSAADACRVVRDHLNRMGIAIETHPMADGGEGTSAAWASHQSGNPAAKPFLEAAHFVGLGDAPRPLRPLNLHTGKLGEAMRSLLDQPFCIGLGGSATVDGGIGLLTALGMEVRGADGVPLKPIPWAMEQAREIVWNAPYNVDVEVWCDVRTPVSDAIRLYGPQKGVLPKDIARLTHGLIHWCELLNRWRTERGLAPISMNVEGGGAAGGLGFALAAAFGATLAPGAATFARTTGLATILESTDGQPPLVILGEGRLDSTSFEGKVAEVVCHYARQLGGTVIALVGSVRSPIPPPPVGPDVVFASGETPDRHRAFLRAVDEVGQWIRARRDRNPTV